MKKILSIGAFCVAAAMIALTVPFCSAWGNDQSRVILEAERVEYDQARGLALATGDVKISRDILRVYAPRVEYDANEQSAVAFASPETPVVLLQGGQRLEGDRLDIDLQTGEGVLTRASGHFPAEKGNVYAAGGDVETISLGEEKNRGWVKSAVPKDRVQGGQVYKWKDTAMTTCPNTSQPHYHLTTRKLVIIPGYRVIANKPRVHVGGKYLFTYPFDYIVDLQKNERSPMAPSLVYESSKGVGIVYGSAFAVGDLSARWKAWYWSKVDFEGALSLEYPASPWMTLFARADYTWNSDQQEKRFRPQWGARLSKNGWSGKIWWSQAESVSIEKELGETFTGTLWRKPEIMIYSPWWADPATGGKFRLMAGWGEYETSATSGGSVTVRRTALGAAYSGSTTIGAIRPFWSCSYWWYDYDHLSKHQDRYDARFGIVWPLGPLTMTSTWTRRWVYGDSPMSWDDYSDSEAFYQKVHIPLGKRWSLSARGGYDILDKDLEEMVYVLTYNNHCCYRVDFTYRDDLVGTDQDDWFALRLIINAFPSNPFYLNSKQITEYGE